MKRLTASIAASLVALTACGLNDQSQVAYDYAKQIGVCRIIATSNQFDAIDIVHERVREAHPELFHSNIQAGVRAAAAEC